MYYLCSYIYIFFFLISCDGFIKLRPYEASHAIAAGHVEICALSNARYSINSFHSES